jgi:hypothetical protein
VQTTQLYLPTATVVPAQSTGFVKEESEGAHQEDTHKLEEKE